MEDRSWSMPEEMMDFIFKLVPEGGTILELGSGYSTYVFDQCDYKIITVEHDPKFLNKVSRATYIHAPIELYSDEYPQLNSVKKRINDHIGWYDRKALGDGLRHATYDCIVIDGPPRDYGRSGILANLNLFPRLNVPILLDDVSRMDDLWIAGCLAKKLERDLLITNNGNGKRSFGIIS